MCKVTGSTRKYFSSNQGNREWLTSFYMVCNQTTYMWQSRQSTRCCDGRWTWSTWRTSRPPPPSPPRRRNGTPHWSSPGWKWDFDQEVNEKQSSFGFWSTHRSFTITTKVPDETSLKEKPHLTKGLNMISLWTQKCYFAWFLDKTIAHLVWKIEEGGLQNHHEDDPLIKRGLRGLVRTLTIITMRYYVQRLTFRFGCGNFGLEKKSRIHFQKI